MAFTPTPLLTNNSNVLLRDQQHAARLFVDDQFRLLPRFKFQFHVAFGINPATLQNINLVQRHSNEINMLVKNCDLPSFTINTETLNQYNRKKNIQTTHKYNPVTITFHDDNMGLIDQLWENYYNYYYADPSSAKDAGAYARTATKNFNYVKNAYGLNNGSQLSFFKYIKMYQMARHDYVEYTLHNPLITSWNHNRVGYAENTAHEKTMGITYEAVSFKTGKVVVGTPEGFGLEHYDKTPSPLKGGTIETTSPTFTSSNLSNAESYINNISTTINTYENTQYRPLDGIIGIVGSSVTSSVSGVAGIVFPTTQNTIGQVTARAVNL